MKQQPTNGQWVAAYEKYVKWIAGEEENWETFAWEALILRDDLAAAWTRLSPAEQARVTTADEQLVACYRQLGALLPGGRQHPANHWWWHLHKGPQVRELAGRTAA
jgi:hypothetical protein